MPRNRHVLESIFEVFVFSGPTVGIRFLLKIRFLASAALGRGGWLQGGGDGGSRRGGGGWAGKARGGKARAGWQVLGGGRRGPGGNRGGTVVEPWWNGSGTVVEPHVFLVEPGFRASLAVCVFALSPCTSPRPTTPFIIEFYLGLVPRFRILPRCRSPFHILLLHPASACTSLG